LTSGADDYLVKPFNNDELILKVRNMIESRNRVREKVRIEFMREGPAMETISADEKLLQKVKEAILNRLSDEQLSVDLAGRRNWVEPRAFLSQNNGLNWPPCK
jgi:DNA-binding response OmpR family regulator